jgi:hypothetical protein
METFSPSPSVSMGHSVSYGKQIPAGYDLLPPDAQYGEDGPTSNEGSIPPPSRRRIALLVPLKHSTTM